MENSMENIERDVTAIIPTVEPDITENNNDIELTEPRVVTGKASFHGKKITLVHRLNTGTLSQLSARDRARPWRSRALGDDEEEILTEPTSTADIALYNATVVETSGYKFNVLPGQSKEDREQALAGIPGRHKRDAIRDITEYQTEIVYENESDETAEPAFEWTENQTYRARTEVGLKGEHVIYSDVSEPSQKQMEDYAGATKYVLEKGQRKPVTRITVELEAAVTLFDSIVKNLEGYTYKHLSVALDDKTKREEQLAKVDPYFKRSVVDKVVKETGLDMGE